MLCSAEPGMYILLCGRFHPQSTAGAASPGVYKCIFRGGTGGLRVPIIDSIAAVAILRSLGTGKSHAVRNLPMRTDAASLGRLEVGQAIYTGPGLRHTELRHILFAKSLICQIAKATAWKRPERVLERREITDPKIHESAGV